MSLDASTSDNTGTFATPDPVPSPNSDDETIKENRTLAFLVYKEVWDEFNKWKVEDCKRQLRLLEQPLPPPSVSEAAKKMASAFRADGGEPGDVEIIYICDTEDDIPLDVGGATVLTCEAVSLTSPPNFEPHPTYESCTPSVQSIAIREAYDLHETVHFVPYADDSTWDVREHLNQFAIFAWENLADPDVEMIQFEVLRRLHFGHGLSLDDIDATRVLPALRQTNRFGLMYQMTQRDELFWPGMMADFPAAVDGSERRGFNFRAHEPNVDDLRGRIESVVPYFCAKPSCIHAYCPLHVKEFPSPPPAVPRLTSKDYPEGAPCGSLCFREIDSTFQEDSIQWESSEEDELRYILEIMPDTTPCGLAKLVRRPCREVFIERRRFIPDEKVYPESSRVVRAREGVDYKDMISGDIMTGAYIPPGPCSHIGPCDKNNENCICVQESVHCTRSCHCSATCIHRWAGCRCNKDEKKRPPQTCATESCKCRKMGWECDPMVCECDNATFVNRKKLGVTASRQWSKRPREMRADGQHFCQNSDIQRGLSAELEVKRGAFGLGCFAVKLIRTNQYLGEYIGELFAASDDKREALRKHIGLNYSFTLNHHHIIDSAHVGNETRYINHGSEREVNAMAKTILVLGEPHIALYATREIKAGGEILFDYGENYWKT